MCPYRISERVRALKLLRACSQGMLLMWDRGLHSYRMVHATLNQGCHYLGRVPKNVKFPVDKVLGDGSYLSWIAPDRKSKHKGGSRIPEEVRSHMFDPFFTTKAPGKGTGLGLSISHQIIVEKHHGQIKCSSKPGEGTEFLIEIPTDN